MPDIAKRSKPVAEVQDTPPVSLAEAPGASQTPLQLDDPSLYVNRELSSLQFVLRVLEQAIIDFPGCAMVISHDRWFLDRIATHILAFEGDSQVVWYEGNYSEYDEDRKKRLGKDADQPHRIRYRNLTRQ